MSSKIKILPDHIINKIAAGEVVERPASVIKELIENSIDAGATEILIDIEQAGRRLIRIADNGSGMSKEDACIAFERHATSKISNDADLEAIRTMGFRGEALSSIAAVSQVRLLTSERTASPGILIEIEGGTLKNTSDAAASRGTSIEVMHLFYNTPARLKFLKSPATEFSHVLTAVSRQAMAYPSVRFKLTHNKKIVLDLPPARSALERVVHLYGNDVADNVFEFAGNSDSIRIAGFISRPAYTRANRMHQDFFVNGRTVRNAALTHALYSAYGDMLMRDRHPLGFIFIELDPALVDVNMHPAKAEVRFRNQTQIHDLVRDVIRESLRTHGMPLTETSVVPDAYHERVKDASAYYLERSIGKDCVEKERRPFILYGRRQNDIIATEFQGTSVPSDHTGVFDNLQSQTSIFSEGVLRPLGQIDDSYIIAQSHDGMAMIDQHAAHERVLFEKLQDQFVNGAIYVQNLLIPVQIELGPTQAGFLVEHLSELSEFGFFVDDFGNNTFIIKGIPSLLIDTDYKKLLLDVLDEVTAHGQSGKLVELRDEMLSVMACHPAIKVNRHLDQKEMETLLDSLFQCRMPHTCPHGRPTVVRFSTTDIKKIFKRI